MPTKEAMSTKLNAEELAKERFPSYTSVAEALAYNAGVEMNPRRIATDAYAAAITEVAQPIADERDAALAKLKEAHEAIERLKRQVELCDYRDGLDHELRMNAAYLDLITLNLPKP